MNEPQLVIVVKNTSVSPEIRAAVKAAETFGEPLAVRLQVAGRDIEAQLEVISGLNQVYGGPRDTTTMVLCPVESVRKPVQEV